MEKEKKRKREKEKKRPNIRKCALSLFQSFPIKFKIFNFCVL